MRILIGGIVAGVVVFLWGIVGHMLLPLGRTGLKMLPNEEPVLSAMRRSIPEPGLYLFPGMDMSKAPSQAEQKAWEAKYSSGPVGLLVYRPHGGKPLSLKLFGIELLSNIAACWVAAMILTRIAGGFGARVWAVTLMGLFGWLAISISYWNWYGFPGSYTMAEGIDQVVGAFFAGLVLAGIIKRAPG